MIFPREQWKNVVGYEGLYEVSSVGRVRNKKTKRNLKPDKDKNGYLRICLYKEGIAKKYFVHRLVAKAFVPNPENKPQIDHINTIKTDNYYKNLRWATPIENSNNKLSRRHNSEAHKGENHPMYGKHLSEEHRRKISEANKGENHHMYGKHHTEEARRKISEAQKGKHHTKETRRKMSEGHKGGKSSLSKRVEIFKNGLSLGIFPSVGELVRQSEELFGKKLNRGHISAVCRGERKSHKGFQFKYVD